MYKINIVPVVTEKSTVSSTQGKYHFFVPQDANKTAVKQQLEKMYGKKVARINSLTRKPKTRIAGKGRVINKRKEQKRMIVMFQGKETIDINKIK
jgi:large subunit ribosomal protein L23